MLGKTLAFRAILCFAIDFDEAAGHGNGPGAVALNPKPADLAGRKFRQTPNIDQVIASTIHYGKGQMPASADLSQDNNRSITIYLKQAF